MTTYNTGNPVPSADARDRYDNSQTLDEVVNGDSESYSSRTGKQVISLGGMNSRFNNAQDARESAFNLSQEEKQESFQSFLDGTGWSSLGAYAAGISFTSHTQTVDYLGQPYSLKPSIPASLDSPYVTTGVWATEGANFKLVGDNSLRQDMAEPDGSNLSGWERNKLTEGIKRAGQALDALLVSAWETAFVMLITDKPVLADPDTWDWRPALNAFAAYLTANHCHGWMPPGRYKINGKINVKATYGWGFIGAGNESTIIEQMMDNTPIFDLGAIAGDSMHSYIIKDMQLTYTNIQPSANTLANPINFSAMGFEGDLLNISFMRGSWAIRCAPGVGGPWGQTWEGLQFKSGLTGGAMDWTGATNSVPDNKWGRFIVTATNMKGPIFKQVRGYTWVIDALEMLDGKNAQWFDIQAGSEVTIHAIKMELLKYTGVTAFPGAALIYAPQGTVLIGQMHVGGTVAEMTPSDALSIINTAAGGYSEIKALTTTLTVPPVNFYLSGSSGGACNINYVKRGSNPMVDYTNIGGNAAAESLTVTPDKNEKLSQPLGDATYLVTYQSPSICIFETPFTAPRDFVLPANNTCFNGLRYRVESRGAVNGSNTLTIKAGGFTKATLTADKTWIDFVWRRGAVPHSGWVAVASGTLP